MECEIIVHICSIILFRIPIFILICFNYSAFFQLFTVYCSTVRRCKFSLPKVAAGRSSCAGGVWKGQEADGRGTMSMGLPSVVVVVAVRFCISDCENVVRVSKDFKPAAPLFLFLSLTCYVHLPLSLCLSFIFNDLMFCELLKLCKQFELSATMRQQQRQQRQQQQLLQRRQQKVAQSFLMLFGGTGYVSVFFCFPPSLPWTHARRGTGSATLMKRLSGSCCTCHSPLNPLPPHCSR